MGHAINRLFSWLQFPLKRIAEFSLAAMMLLTFIDVLGRYVFGFPVAGSVELTEMLMVLAIFSGVPLATAARMHVAVDLLTMGLGPRARRVQLAAAHLLAMMASILFGVVSWGRATAAHEYQDRTTILSLPIAPMVFFMSILLFVNALGNAAHLWGVVSRRSDHA